MEILKMKVVEKEGKKEVIEIPINVEDKSVPAQQFKVEIQKDTPLKSQKQSKFVVKNMNEYQFMEDLMLIVISEMERRSK